jgi:hypothetical protein
MEHNGYRLEVELGIAISAMISYAITEEETLYEKELLEEDELEDWTDDLQDLLDGYFEIAIAC